MDKDLKIATVGGGCFWCVEAVFLEVVGVHKVVSGYSGGNAPGEPTYREICSGLTGHAEVVEVHFDPDQISYADLLVIFMTTHDPTQLNRQGADVGTQYRSVIFYHDPEQEQTAKEVIKQVASYYDQAVVTQVSPASIFYKATQEHQNFYRSDPNRGYCTYVINPKLAKLRELHADKLKS